MGFHDSSVQPERTGTEQSLRSGPVQILIGVGEDDDFESTSSSSCPGSMKIFGKETPNHDSLSLSTTFDPGLSFRPSSNLRP